MKTVNYVKAKEIAYKATGKEWSIESHRNCDTITLTIYDDNFELHFSTLDQLSSAFQTKNLNIEHTAGGALSSVTWESGITHIVIGDIPPELIS